MADLERYSFFTAQCQGPYVGVDFLYIFTQGAVVRKPLTSRPCECSSCSVKALFKLIKTKEKSSFHKVKGMNYSSNSRQRVLLLAFRSWREKIQTLTDKIPVLKKI